jgi:RNA polymerase sigma-70 factor (ECF subfamily)
MWTPSEVDALYRETRYAVFLRCRSLLRDEAEARDVTQEVYLYLLDHPAEFRGDAAPATYLYAIATNRSLSRIRARIVRDERWRDAVAGILRDRTPEIDPEAVATAHQLLSKALEGEDDDTVLILIHHFVDGLSQGEIASMLGVSRVTVNQRIQRFRERAKDTAEAGQ